MVVFSLFVECMAVFLCCHADLMVNLFKVVSIEREFYLLWNTLTMTPRQFAFRSSWFKIVVDDRVVFFGSIF